MVNVKRILVLCWVAVGWVHLATASALADRPAKPNVLLLLTDDLGWQDVGCYDIDEPTPFETPNIDQLATRGMKFWQAYSPAPTCAPSRCAILAGKHPARLQKTHVLGGRPPTPHAAKSFRLMPPWYRGGLSPSEVTIADALKANGYTTGHVGKWHVSVTYDTVPRPEDLGFDFSQNNHGAVRRMKPDRLSEFATADPNDPYRLDENGYPYHQSNVDALNFLRERKDKPFFLYYATRLVHAPIQTRNEALLRKYADKMGVPYPKDAGTWKIAGQKNPYYGAMVEELDYYVGKVFDYLDETDDPRWPGHKLSENTYVIFTSDNGGFVHAGPEQITSNKPLREGKINPEEGGTRVPLIITGPGIAAGTQSSVMANGLDFYPTILSWTGTTPPQEHHLDGCDLSTLLSNDCADAALVVDAQGEPRDTMTWHFPHSISMKSTIRQGDYKLIRNWDHVANPKKVPFELYRLYETDGQEPRRVDIEESNNLAAAMPEKVRELDALLEASLQEMEAGYPHYNPHYPGKLPGKEAVPVVTDQGRAGRKVWLTYADRGARVVRGQLVFTANGGDREEEWDSLPVTGYADGRVDAVLPDNATHYVFNLIDENGFLVSYPEMGQMVGRNRKVDYTKGALVATD